MLSTYLWKSDPFKRSQVDQFKIEALDSTSYLWAAHKLFTFVFNWILVGNNTVVWKLREVKSECKISAFECLSWFIVEKLGIIEILVFQNCKLPFHFQNSFIVQSLFYDIGKEHLILQFLLLLEVFGEFFFFPVRVWNKQGNISCRGEWIIEFLFQWPNWKNLNKNVDHFEPKVIFFILFFVIVLFFLAKTKKNGLGQMKCFECWFKMTFWTEMSIWNDIFKTKCCFK